MKTVGYKNICCVTMGFYIVSALNDKVTTEEVYMTPKFIIDRGHKS
jgi:hypothetical protein